MELFRNLKTEKSVFYSLLLINIAAVFFTKFYPSMDGPAHLYNANLLAYMLQNNRDLIHSCFTLNTSLIPNWTSYLVLVFLKFFMPGWLCEKMLIIVYITGIALSFRYLLRQLCPSNLALSILIFPFASGVLFHLGFYNYSLSFIFFYLVLGYYVKNAGSMTAKKYGMLFLLLVLTYFSAMLTFLFTGIVTGCIIIILAIKALNNGEPFRPVMRKAFVNMALLLAVSLPCLILSILFIRSTTFFEVEQSYPTGELVKWINDVRCLIVYDYKDEEKITGQFLHILIAVIAIGLFIRISRSEKSKPLARLQTGDFLVMPMLLVLILLFTTPNDSSAGMMSDRYILLFYMLFIAWGAAQEVPRKANVFFSCCIILLHFCLLYKYQFVHLKALDKDAVTIYDASYQIPEKSIVLPVNLSENWLQPHFSNYMGADRPMVILENYEASVGWFPVKWNTGRMPHIRLGPYDQLAGVSWPSNPASQEVRQVDYICLTGNADKLQDPERKELKAVIDSFFVPHYTSPDRFVTLYKAR